MYLKHFNLNQSPFAEKPDLDIFFPEAARQEILQTLYQDLLADKPLIRLIGKEGYGKTMLCRLLLRDLPADDFEVVFLDNPVGSFDDLLHSFCRDLGMEPAKVDDVDLADELSRLLKHNQARKKQVVLIVDEAEKLFLAALERLMRTLSESDNVLHIILSGRPALEESLEQLDAYCSDISESTSYILEPFTEEETRAYINFRLTTVGLPENNQDDIFSREAVRKIFETTKGNLRLVNILAEEALQATSADKSFLVLFDHVVEQNDNSGETPANTGRSAGQGKKPLLLTVVLLALLAGGGWYYFNRYNVVVGPSISDNDSGKPVPVIQRDKPSEPSKPVPGEPAQDEPVPSEPEQPVVTTPIQNEQPAEQPEDKPVVAAVEEPVVKQDQTDQPVQQIEQEPLEQEPLEQEPLETLPTDEVHTKPVTAPTEPEQPEEDQVTQSTVPEQPVETSPPVEDEPEIIELTPVTKKTRPNTEQTVEMQDDLQSGTGESRPDQATAEVTTISALQPDNEEEITAQSTRDTPVINESVANIAASAEPEPAASQETEVSREPLDPHADEVYQRRLSAAAKWHLPSYKEKFTVQMLMLASQEAETNVRKMLIRDEYLDIETKLYILRKKANDQPALYIFYGIFDTMDEARNARNTMPLFLRKHHPYPLSIIDAMKKAE